MTDAQERINALWNQASKGYDHAARHGVNDNRERAAWLDALRELLPPPPADVLDVGTGTGVIALLVAELGHRVRGVDLADEMLAQARRKAAGVQLNVTFERGDALDPPGDEADVDVVINRHVLWTMTDPSRALANWRRLLRPGGRIVVIDAICKPDERLGDLAEALPLADPNVTQDDIRRLAEEAGFVDVAFLDLAEVERVQRELHGEPDGNPAYVLTALRR